MFDTLGFGLLALIVAMSISMALIPVMIRLAPRLGMLDKPDPRKVHAVPIPRVGGVGIVIGALIPMLLWLPWNDLTVSFLLGSAVLLIFGLWDDMKELGHYVKFIGQFIAVLLVVYYGGLYVSELPFLGEISETVGKIFTVIAIVGVINAINHSDGLDGLAGGESLISFAAVAYLAASADDMILFTITLATIGGILGFLRFNSHPAKVFMGDGGSQFLGFTLAFVVLYLTQISNRTFSPALPALIIGLPIVDIIAVFAQRIYHKMNWFKASRNHIHHRLLDIGFHHYESVSLIYSIQVLLVLSGLLLSYEYDSVLLGIYFLVCGLLFGFLVAAEHNGWKVNTGPGAGNKISFAYQSGIMTFSRRLIEVMLSVFVISGALFVTSVPADLAIVSGVLGLFLLIRLMLGFRVWFLFLRLIVFVAIALVVYLLEIGLPVFLQGTEIIQYAFYGILLVLVALVVRATSEDYFQVTPSDYLIVLLVLMVALMSKIGLVDEASVGLVARIIVLFYGAEVILRHMKNRWNLFTLSVLASLVIILSRELFSI